MPATSAKQKKFMDAAAHNPAFAKAAGVPQSVAKDFSKQSKGAKFDSGPRTRADRQAFGNPKTNHGKAALFKEGGHMKESKAMMAKEVSFMKKAGAPKSMVKHEMAEAKMAKGGIATSLKAHAAAPASKAHAGMKSGGMTKMGAVKTSSKPDGVITKGKTKGTMVTMKRGGKAC
jgi:hypothetical protein